MFYRAYIFQNVNVSRFSKVKTKLKLFKGHQCLLSRVGLFPLEFLQRLKDSLKTGRLFHLGFFFLMYKRWGSENKGWLGQDTPTFWRLFLQQNEIHTRTSALYQRGQGEGQDADRPPEGSLWAEGEVGWAPGPLPLVRFPGPKVSSSVRGPEALPPPKALLSV